jgi:hypothetical protein
MRPHVESKQLLYISDPGNNDVEVYSYPPKGSSPLVGTLTGLSEPQGECVDATGSVWIANTNASTIVEFAHGGTSPIATLSDPGESPASCDISKVTGDLAVVNLKTASSNGSVSIYKGARGNPTNYSPSEIVSPLFIAYAGHNELFVDGFISDGTPRVAIKRPKVNHFLDFGLTTTIGLIGGLQWDGTYLAVGDRSEGKNAVYRFGVGTRRLNLKGTVYLKKACEVMQFFISGDAIVAPDSLCPSANTYKYPAGGLSERGKRITQGLVAPFGSVISP